MNAEKLMKIIGDADDEYVQSALDSRNRKRESRGRRLTFRTVLVAAIIMSLAVTVYASDGQIIKTLADTWWSKSYSSFQDLDRAAEQAGFEMDAKEKFDNGYAFQRMEVQEVRGLDGDRNERLRYKELYIDYRNPQGQAIFLAACPDLQELQSSAPPAKQARKIGEITIEYRESRYKLLPAEKEGKLTEEEQLWQQQPGNYISYGADEAHERIITSVTWVKDGIFYHLLDLDAQANADTLFAMAGELIAIP